MSKKKSSEEIRVYISEGSSGNNIRHLRLELPSQFKSGPNKLQSSGKSLTVLAPAISKRNLKTVFTETGKTMPTVIEKNYPKTKLTARDKSEDRRSLSSRLNTFPPEKIKKIDGNTLLQQSIIPKLNNHEPFYAPFPEQNIGYGDALANSQQIQITPRRQSKNSSISQTNMPHTYRIANPNQSEGVLPSQKPEALGEQSRRPFVANLPNGLTIHEVLPKKQVTPRPIVCHLPTVDHTRQSNQEQNNFKLKEQESMKPEQNQQQESPQPRSEIQEPDYEKQPIGGRVAALHLERILQQKEVSQKPILQSQMVQKQIPQHIQQQPMQHYQTEPHQIETIPQHQLPQEQIQHLSHNHPVSHDRDLIWSNATPISESVKQPIQLSSQEAYQQLQKNSAHQQHMQQTAMAYQEQMMMNQMQQRAYYNYYYQQQQKPQESISPGMTSPQDLSHRVRHHHVQHITDGNQGCHQNLIPNSKDDPSAGVQLNSFPIDLVTPNRKEQQSHAQTTPQWHPLHQTNAIYNTQNNSQNTENNSQPNHNCQQNNSNDHKIRSTLQRQVEALDTQQKRSERKKVYHFTPQMIRIQEKLVATMQQQRIPEDVMQRQFQLLLNEQKKQLAYFELVTLGEGGAEKSPTHRVSKKVTTLQIDERPEWMAHITPPRIPYSDLEKVKTCSLHVQQNNEESVQQEKHRNQIQTDQYHHQNQIQDQEKQFLYNEQEAAHQQQIAYQQYQRQLQQQRTQHQHRTQVQEKQVKLQENQTQNQANSCHMCQHHMTGEQRRSDQLKISNSYYPYERTRSLSMPALNNYSPQHLQHKNLQYNYPHQYYQQPSSLLQVRLYKEIIQPQKRNNGLQDPETVREALEALKNADTKKGLEYLANLNKKEAVVRLNGVQDPDEVSGNLSQRPPEKLQEMRKQVSANGLENKRNPNNPLPKPKIRHLKDRSVEFPRTKNSYRLQNHTHIVERENESVPPILHSHPNQQIDYAHDQTFPINLSKTQNLPNNQQLKHNQQLKQFYKNRQILSNAEGDAVVPELREIPGNECMNQSGGDQQNKTFFQQHGGIVMGSTNIQEPIVIGGVTYLARKPSYIPNVQVSAGSYGGNSPSLPNVS